MSGADEVLARRHAPIVYFDTAEPFSPQLVGWSVLRQPGPSPTFDRYLHTSLPDGRRTAAVIEYALWTDWDCQHLYELEHVWSYVDAAGRLLHAEASWHGGHGPLVQDGRLSSEDERPVAYAQPGKHAMTPTPHMFAGFDLMRDWCAHAAGPASPRRGLLVGKPIAGRMAATPRADALINAYLHTQAFQPTFRFEGRWDARATPFVRCADLVAQIPARLEAVIAELEATRAKRRIWVVLFDLGDTLMVEETEEKDETLTTQRADLFPGAAEMIWRLRGEGYLIGMVADTRPGTYRNVLRQHKIENAFDVFAISEELDCEKPDARMFEHAIAALGLLPEESAHVVMVGNNLARDVRGANAAGMISLWVRFNDRYPATPADALEEPHFTAHSCAEALELLLGLG